MMRTQHATASRIVAATSVIRRARSPIDVKSKLTFQGRQGLPATSTATFSSFSKVSGYQERENAHLHAQKDVLEDPNKTLRSKNDDTLLEESVVSLSKSRSHLMAPKSPEAWSPSAPSSTSSPYFPSRSSSFSTSSAKYSAKSSPTTGETNSKQSPLMARSWSRMRSLLSSNPGKTSGAPHFSSDLASASGWYGQARLVDVGSFEHWRKEAEADCRILRDLAVAFDIDPKSDNAAQQGREFLQLLDSVSARLCLLLDTAEICASSHADAKMRQAAAESYARLSAYVTKLNMDALLYRPLAVMVENPDILADLGDEEQRVAISLKLEFERDGIHLSAKEKEHVEVLQAEMRSAEIAFANLERHSSGQLRLGLAESTQVFMDASALGRFGSLDPKSIPPSYKVNVNNASLNIALRNVSDGSLRKRFYLKAYSEGFEKNLAALDGLVTARRKLANALNYESYAHLNTSYRMAGNPGEVLKFLDRFSERIAPRAQAEARELQALKDRYEPNSGRLQAWDVPYYTNLAIKSQFGTLMERSYEYFTLDGCLQGLQMICNSLFGIRFENVPMGPGESWADGVQKLQVREHDGTPAGTLYLDLYARPGKFSNPAHFQVRCSHMHRPMSLFGVSKASMPVDQAAAKAYTIEESQMYYELPTSVLLCNFERPGALMHHTQVQTLFHEFGHALHSLLSRTEYQHLSGTRGELDFVETPSQLMEYFAFDDRVIRMFARHHSTGEPIPHDVVNALSGARRKFQAMEYQQQVMYAACDQLLFGSGQEAENVQKIVRDPTAASDVLRKLHEKYTLIPYTEGTFWLARFSHFVNYGAAYYSYTYSRTFAADLWHTRLAESPLDRRVGDDLRAKMLSYGGSRDPRDMLEDLLGREASVDPLIDELTV
mmetsp:Transcript_10330/g.20321  ORF Transcript_10330/g.20321 Transcript_10330/m.20321 type:complete len:890 (-) Transcript_10330:525-3194(-)|eukprot:CAMPEP_0171542632 /NCGR_PEP_ID=MMETSP0960-20121227/2470_1 /TAXON_ID=87120 /ORGANISM="Aurantiochytrium limacinum, Strain ATCCMYA-1381" /LENGTH=889 /DNA_ID=CAMNT_0012090185 /DNA_START=69 /DNA_END=2738 /DNA_ORIENTATION=+